MEEKEIIENNKLIAEFLGWELEETLEGEWIYAIKANRNPDKLSDIQTEFYSQHELLYHFSWDWLMPAWFKWQTLEFKDRKSKDVNYYWDEQIEEAILYPNEKTPLEAFKILSNAIKWYNGLSRDSKQT